MSGIQFPQRKYLQKKDLQRIILKEQILKETSSEKDTGYESSKHHEKATCSGLQSSEKKKFLEREVLQIKNLFLILIDDFVVKINLKRK